jgi:hypothetical protein
MTVQTKTGDCRVAAAWGSAAAATVMVALAIPLLHDPRYFFYGDTQAAYYGWWFHLGEQVRSGSWPLLDPQAWRAGNLAAEGQWGLWSPLVLGIGLLASVAGNVLLLASGVKVALAVTGSLGVFLLARSYRVPHPAAYVAAVTVPLGGMTQYLDLPSWAAGLMIWALLPWAWWALRRAMRPGRSPLPALVLVYLLVTVGYVYGTIMLILVLVACLVDCLLRRRATGDHGPALKVLAVAVFAGLVATTVYLPGVLSVGVTVRESEFGGFGGKFSTDPLAMVTSVLPTASVPGTSAHLLPYAYAAWILPVLAWVDLRSVRAGWRPLAGLFLMTVMTLVVVDGIARFGPLRWPLRLQPFLVQVLVLLTVVLVSRFLVRRPSARRLALSLAWVLLAGAVAVARAPALWTAHLVAVVVVLAGLLLLWRVLSGRAARRLPWAAITAAGFSLALLGLQHAFFPTPPSPQRNLPAERGDYRTQLATAEGDVLVVGDATSVLEARPAAAASLLSGSAWYLDPHPVQNTYTTISHRAYYDRYCIHYDGSTCPGLLDTLFSTEPTTGLRRVDLLAVSTLVLVREDFPDSRVASPPTGWRVAGRTPFAVTWVREDPVPGAGGPVWASPGTRVSVLASDARDERLRVDHVPAGGGRVVLSRVAWPGYRTDVGSLADPVDGYLLTLDLPPGAEGRTVTVAFSPPGWALEVASWWVAVVGGAAWTTAWWWRRRRRPTTQAGPGPTSSSSSRASIRGLVSSRRG